MLLNGERNKLGGIDPNISTFETILRLLVVAKVAR